MEKLLLEFKFKNMKCKISEIELEQNKGWVYGYIQGQREILATYYINPKKRIIESCIKACKSTINNIIEKRYIERYNFNYNEKIIWNKPKNIKRKYFKTERRTD